MAALVAVFAGLRLLGSAGGQAIVCRPVAGEAIAISGSAAVSLSIAARADEETLVEIIEALAIGLRRNNCNRRRTIAINDGLRLVLRILLLVLVEFFGHLVDEALVVLGVLQVAFRQDAVASGSCIACESHIFFIDLVSGAANAHIGAIAVEGLNTRIDASAAHLAIAVVVPAVMAVATITSTVTAHTSCVLIVSHADFFFTSLLTIGLSSNHWELLFDLMPWCISCYKASVMSSEIGESLYHV